MLISTHSFREETGWSSRLPGYLDGSRTLVLTFAINSAFDPSVTLRSLTTRFAKSVHLGCSSAANVIGTQVCNGGIVVAVVQFEHSELHAAGVELADATDASADGIKLARQLPSQGLRAVMLLSSAPADYAEALSCGLIESLPAGVAVMGALAGRNAGHAWVFDGVLPARGRTRVVGFYGSRLRIGQGAAGQAAAAALPGAVVQATRQATVGMPPRGPELIVSICSAARRSLHGAHYDQQWATVLDGTSGDASHVGFCSHGHLPLAFAGRAACETNLTVTAIAEA